MDIQTALEIVIKAAYDMQLRRDRIFTNVGTFGPDDIGLAASIVEDMAVNQFGDD